MTADGRDRLQWPEHIDEVLLGSLPGMVGPRAGIKGHVQCDQPDDFGAGLVVEFLKGDLETILWPRSPHAQAGAADAMKVMASTGPTRSRNGLESPRARRPHLNMVVLYRSRFWG